MSAIEEVSEAVETAASNCLTVAKACYYWDSKDIQPTKVIPFDEIPLRYKLRYLDLADYVLSALTFAE